MNKELMAKAHEILDMKESEIKLMRAHNILYPVVGSGNTPILDLESTLKSLLREIEKAKEEFYHMYDMVKSIHDAKEYVVAIEKLEMKNTEGD